MQKAAYVADISVLFFSAGANFWVIFGQFWVIFGLFWVIFGPFFGANFFGRKFISAIFITFCISAHLVLGEVGTW